jgi:hypothetical protein
MSGRNYRCCHRRRSYLCQYLRQRMRCRRSSALWGTRTSRSGGWVPAAGLSKPTREQRRRRTGSLQPWRLPWQELRRRRHGANRHRT